MRQTRGEADVAKVARIRQMATDGRARQARESAGVSGRELAHVLGIDPATYYRWEKGEARPRWHAALRWADALDRIGVPR